MPFEMPSGMGFGGDGVADMMKMANAMAAFQRQAADHIAAAKQALASAGKGFSADDLAAIEASHAAHPYPEGYGPGETPPADAVAEAQDAAHRAMEADYPEHGFSPDDPRIAPVEGISLALLAIAAKAIGWNTDDAFTDRIATALGLDPATYRRATEAWRERVTDDIVLGAYYAQLFSAA